VQKITYYSNLGHMVKYARSAKDFTQEQLSEKVGMASDI
jgi:transcriptional regulator with XRE-family HTH domain